jgi:acyl-CoA thioester hydrolase
MPRPAPRRRADYRFFSAVATRWADNDIYGHVNNVVYYGLFDTAVGHYMLREAGLDPWKDGVFGVVVETGCRYHRSMAFPDTAHVGLRVAHLGNTSVRYEIGVFRNDEDASCADGHFVHVFVEREGQRPVPIPPRIRAALERILIVD